MPKNYIDGKCISCGETVRIYFVEESSAGELRDANPMDILEIDLEEDLYCSECDPEANKMMRVLKEKSGS